MLNLIELTLLLILLLRRNCENEIKFIPIIYLETMNIISYSSMYTENASETNNKENNNNKENEDYNTDLRYVHRWTEKETKYLLDQYRMYFPQIGPMRLLKNKAAMYDQISKDLFTKFSIKVTGQQCLNRYKNVSKQNKKALFSNKVPGNTSTEVPYDSEFEEIKSTGDSLQPEVLLGVNQIKFNKRTRSFNKINIDVSNVETSQYEKPSKRLKPNSMEEILRQISDTAEKNKERRHKEKCDLLGSLLEEPDESDA